MVREFYLTGILLTPLRTFGAWCRGFFWRLMNVFGLCLVFVSPDDPSCRYSLVPEKGFLGRVMRRTLLPSVSAHSSESVSLQS